MQLHLSFGENLIKIVCSIEVDPKRFFSCAILSRF